MNRFPAQILFISLFVFSIGCETGIENVTDEKPPSIIQFNVNPTQVLFDRNVDQLTDTTIALTISGQIKHLSENSRDEYFVIHKSSETVIAIGEIGLNSIPDNLSSFEQVINIEVSTTETVEFIINVVARNVSGNGNYAQSMLSVIGIPNNAPEIIGVSNPESITIPQNGTINVPFTAKVTDRDGQNSINGVYLRLFSRTTGEATNSPFQLFDDGASYGDLVANDSVYTLTFPVSSANVPDTYDIFYYALDSSALVSDTVKTTFRLTE